MGFSGSDGEAGLNKTSILAGNALRYTIIILSVVTALASCATSPYDTPEIRRVGSAGSALGKCLERPQNRILFQTKIRKKSLQCLITHAWRNERQCRMLSSRLVCRWIISITEKVDTKSHYGGCTFYSRPRISPPRASKGEARVPMPVECKEHRCGG